MEILVNDYNKRIVSICVNLFELTQNDKFDRFGKIVQHDIDTSNTYEFLWKHIEQMNPEYIQEIISGNRQYFESDQFTDHRVDNGLVSELKNEWSNISTKNQNIIFTKMQNIFKIAEHIRNHYYDELVLHAMGLKV